MVQRVTYRRRLSYNTQSNKVRKVRTPGSKVVVQYVQKRGHGPRASQDSCACGERINGIPQLRPYHYKKLAKKDKTVSRPYGGVLCGPCVKSRIIRAFLLEEIKTIKRAKQASKKWSLFAYLNLFFASYAEVRSLKLGRCCRLAEYSFSRILRLSQIVWYWMGIDYAVVNKMLIYFND